MAKNSDTEKTVSRKQTLHDQWVAAGSNKMNKSDKKAFVTEYKKLAAAKAAAEEALETAQSAVSDLVAGMIRGAGKGRLRIDGEVFVPMSRGETCYLRAEGGGDVEDF
jgi:hypothetical protein